MTKQPSLISTQDRVGLIHKMALELADHWADMGYFRNCLNCSYFQQNTIDEYQYRCEKHNQIPPPRILVQGCEQHSDTIPF